MGERSLDQVILTNLTDLNANVGELRGQVANADKASAARHEAHEEKDDMRHKEVLRLVGEERLAREKLEARLDDLDEEQAETGKHQLQEIRARADRLEAESRGGASRRAELREKAKLDERAEKMKVRRALGEKAFTLFLGALLAVGTSIVYQRLGLASPPAPPPSVSPATSASASPAAHP
jgi:hypothetical protein